MKTVKDLYKNCKELERIFKCHLNKLFGNLTVVKMSVAPNWPMNLILKLYFCNWQLAIKLVLQTEEPRKVKTILREKEK